MDIHIVSPHNAKTFEELRRRNYPFNRTFVLTLDSFVRLSERTGLRPQELIGYIRTELIPVGSVAYSYDDASIDYRLRLPNDDVPDAVLAFFDPKTLRSQLNMSRKAFATLFIQMILDVSPYVGYSLMALMYRLSQMDGSSSPIVQQAVVQPVQPLASQTAPFTKKRKRKDDETPSRRSRDDDDETPVRSTRRRRKALIDDEEPVSFTFRKRSSDASSVVPSTAISTATSESELESSKLLSEQMEKAKAMGLLSSSESESETPSSEKPVVKTSDLLNRFL